jgi:hypothetical protein
MAHAAEECSCIPSLIWGFASSPRRPSFPMTQEKAAAKALQLCQGGWWYMVVVFTNTSECSPKFWPNFKSWFRIGIPGIVSGFYFIIYICYWFLFVFTTHFLQHPDRTSITIYPHRFSRKASTSLRQIFHSFNWCLCSRDSIIKSNLPSGYLT